MLSSIQLKIIMLKCFLQLNQLFELIENEICAFVLPKKKKEMCAFVVI